MKRIIDDIKQRIESLVPDADYDCYENNYYRIFWRDNRKQPTLDAILGCDPSEKYASYIIPDLWLRLNTLVPAPKCSTRNNDYNSIVWNDERPLPDIEALEMVAISTIEYQEPTIKEVFEALSEAVEDGRKVAKINDLKERFSI